MTDIIVIALVIAVGLSIFNGFAAGVVSALYFWRNHRNTTQRAILGAFVSGLTCAGIMLGPVVLEGLNAAGESTIAIVVVVALCAAVSLPGAFIMSRKIAKADPLGDTFR